ncbi:MAG: putative electron transport protein YccM [Syntrophorhabdus sp. PtaB.Bin047]|jgi:polyferredoxin|nr:MAG: putative electron transport protein YccM [Syntrophorhabdus sp. PtaB.Bin047]
MGERGERGSEKERRPVKAAFDGAKRSRRLKQVVLGSIFVVLLVGGWFYSLVGYFIPLCMVAGVGLASVRGRKWCNWMCPRGSFADTYMKVISPGRKIPGWLRGTPVRMGVLAFLMAMLVFQIARLWPDPYAIGRFFVMLLTITTVVGLFMALFLHQRAWCSICPIGSLSSWVGKDRYPLDMDKDACVSCGLCAKTCPMQLAPQEMKENETMSFKGDCLKCGLCVRACPKQALHFPA